MDQYSEATSELTEDDILEQEINQLSHQIITYQLYRSGLPLEELLQESTLICSDGKDNGREVRLGFDGRWIANGKKIPINNLEHIDYELMTNWANIRIPFFTRIKLVERL